MTRPKRRNRSFHIEFLERRDTPSTITGRPSIIRSAVGQSVAPFTVVGAGMVTSQSEMANNNMMIQADVHGQSVRLGRFTGRFSVMAPNNGPPIVIHAVLQGRDRSTVQLTIILTEAFPGDRDPETSLLLHGTFCITGGTSPFALPGCGTASLKVNTLDNTFTFVLKGQTPAWGET
jgi:hypothetical protein